METPEQAIRLVMNHLELSRNIRDIVTKQLDLTSITDDQVEDLGWNISLSEAVLASARRKLLVERGKRWRNRDIDELDR